MFSQASPAKFYVSIVFSFSWDGSNTPEKRKTKVMQRLAGGGGGGQLMGIMGDVQE